MNGEVIMFYYIISLEIIRKKKVRFVIFVIKSGILYERFGNPNQFKRYDTLRHLQSYFRRRFYGNNFKLFFSKIVLFKFS